MLWFHCVVTPLCIVASCSLLKQPPTQETLVQLKSALSSLDGGNKTSLNRKGRGEEGELLMFVSYTNETFKETLLVNHWTGFGRRVTFRCWVTWRNTHLGNHYPSCLDNVFENIGTNTCCYLSENQHWHFWNPVSEVQLGEVSTKDHQDYWGNAFATIILLSTGWSPPDWVTTRRPRNYL